MIRFGWKRRSRGAPDPRIQQVRNLLGRRSIVLVGLMGCGKSSIGRRLAGAMELPFVDADDEIERSAHKSIPEIFADHGEQYFRAGERKVIARLLRNGPQVLATGGGAFMNAETRAAIASAGISVWLRAELDVLVRRVAKRDDRPLLKQGNPTQIMQALMTERYPVYAGADLTVDSRDVPHEVIVGDILAALEAYLTSGSGPASDTAPTGAAPGTA